MHAPPSAEMRSPAVWENGRAKSQQEGVVGEAKFSPEPVKAQARGLFALSQAAVCTLATLAYRVAQ